ncbi:hypothetical protein CEXT_694211 [Caerostris extrusa]|uniref:Uncharacterized protein n=1 Tax=Caerostris extrusa TaxID=172846 RepID=A0AAV4WQL9_CAEEX|nr:hypothetical protein CEXT_694211 [Caerostris extrusa]
MLTHQHNSADHRVISSKTLHQALFGDVLQRWLAGGSLHPRTSQVNLEESVGMNQCYCKRLLRGCAPIVEDGAEFPWV